MTYAMQIGIMGNVTSVVLEKDTMGNKSMDACIQSKVKQWRFMRAKESTEAVFTLQFTQESASQ